MFSFKALGDALRQGFAKLAAKKVSTNPNHTGIVSALDNIETSALNVLSLYANNIPVFSKLQDRLTKSPSSDNRPLAKIVEKFAKAAKAPPMKPVEALQAAIETIAKDTEDLTTHFSEVFGDLKTLDDMRVSHGFVFGYMTLARRTVEFFQRMTYLVDANELERPPAYLIKTLERDAEVVGQFVGMLKLRTGSGTKTIMDDLKKLSRGTANMFMFSDGKTIDEFASGSDYMSTVTGPLTMGLSLNPVIWVIDALLERERTIHERDVKTREWLGSRVALLEMDLAGVDPMSAEYKKQKKIVATYTQMIAALDKKIAEYENG